MAPSRKVADAKAKAKKQKVYAIVGAVLMVAVLAYEIPNTMKLMKATGGQTQQSSPAPAPVRTTTVSTKPAPGTPPADGSLTPPTLSRSAPASTPASSSGLVNSDPAPVPGDGQLVKFDKFVAKDPFKQQLGAVPTSGSGSTPTGTTTTPGVTAVPPGGGTATPAPPAANATAATIEVNGVAEDVRLDGLFPKGAAQPYFKLVSLGSTSVKIGIAGGSLAGGGQTVELAKGKKLTLMNTADGTKYALRLVALK